MLDSYERFAGLLTTEDSAPFVLEDWQREVVEDIFASLETLLLLPKSNGKTALLASLALFHLVTTPNAQCYVAAASRDQATLLYGYAHGYIIRSSDLQGRLLARPGYREIRTKRAGDLGFLKVLASDADTADGVAPTLALVDELHRHRNGDLYAALRDGLGKRGGQLVTISTAGWDEQNSPLGQLRRAALSLPVVERHGSHTVARSDGFVMHEWAVPEGSDTNDLEVVKQANPSSFVTIENLAARRDSPSMRESDWLRFACNIWTAGENTWLPDGAWAACARPGQVLNEGDAIVLGFDGSFAGDSTALVACTVDTEVPFVTLLGLWENARDDPNWRVPRGEVLELIRDLCKRFAVREVACDPYLWIADLEQLLDEGLPIVKFDQFATRTIPATQRAYEAIVAGQLEHDASPDLARHIANAVPKTDARGTRLSKDSKHSKRRIDACIAAVMAIDRAAQRGSVGVWDLNEVVASLRAKRENPDDDSPATASAPDAPKTPKPSGQEFISLQDFHGVR